MEKSLLVGVYELTSPSGKVYVGQSWDIQRRFNRYKNLNCKKQRKLFNSLNKYGLCNHRIKILELFYGDGANQETLDRIEIANIKYNKDIGNELLNLASGGSRGKHSEETLAILRDIRGEKNPSFGKKRSKEFCEKRRGEGNPNFGNRGPKNPNFGKKQTEERRLKTSGENNYWYGKRGSDIHFYGKKQSPEHVAKRSGKNHCRAKAVIDTSTGKIYDTITLAAKDLNITSSAVQWRIKSGKYNLELYKGLQENKDKLINIQHGKLIIE